MLATWTHFAIHTRTLRAPQSTLQWGLSTVSVGFGLLVVAVLTSWRFARLGASRPVEE